MQSQATLPSLHTALHTAQEQQQYVKNIKALVYTVHSVSDLSDFYL